MRSLWVVVPCSLVLASCSVGTPMTQSALPSAPTALTAAASAPRSLSEDPGATTSRFDFQQPVAINVPSECFGGTFHITGTIYVSDEIATNPNGYQDVASQGDFSHLTATLIGDASDVWVAAPGSHEIFSNRVRLGSGPVRVVHEGRTRLISDTASDVRFIHRIHYLVLPSGEVQLSDVTFEADCY